MYIKAYVNGEQFQTVSTINDVQKSYRISKLSFNSIIPEVTTVSKNISKYRSNTIKKLNKENKNFQSNLLTLWHQQSRFEHYLKNNKVKQMKCKYKANLRIKSCDSKSKCVVFEANLKDNIIKSSIHNFSSKKANQQPIIFKKLKQNNLNKFKNQSLKLIEKSKNQKNDPKMQIKNNFNQFDAQTSKSQFQCYPKNFISEKKISLDGIQPLLYENNQVTSRAFTIKRRKFFNYQSKTINYDELSREPTDKTIKSIRPWGSAKNECDQQLHF